MKIVNLTPHDIAIIDDNTQTYTLPSEGSVRLVEHVEPAEDINQIPVVRKSYAQAEGLPEPQAGTIYIVSKMVQDALPHRTDLLSPDTGPDSAVRDADGRIIGVKRLQRSALPETANPWGDDWISSSGE